MRGDAKTAARMSEQVAEGSITQLGCEAIDLGLIIHKARPDQIEKGALLYLQRAVKDALALHETVANLEECDRRLARMLGESDGE